MSEHPTDVPMPAGRPRAEIDVDETLARRLLAAQHPDLAGLPLTLLDSGWDNVMFRLGDRLTMRIPRREVAARLLLNEQVWLPELAPRLPIPVPVPVRIGQPTRFYPWPWSVCPYFEGECSDVAPPASREAERFAGFLLALHQPAPDRAPRNPIRGIPIQARAADTEARLHRVRAQTTLVTAQIEQAWENALAAPACSDARWLHGDLHAQNVLVASDGRLSAVIDWGDLTAGDPATDLAAIWGVFESPGDRQRILDQYRPVPALLERARGWAVLFGAVLIDAGSVSSPRHAAAGRRLLERLADDG